MKLRKLNQILLSISTAFGLFMMPVYAEGEEESEPTASPSASASYDFSDTTYWTNLCTGDDASTAANRTACQAFLQHQSSQSQSLYDAIEQIEKQREEIAKNVQYYAQQVQQYQEQAESLNAVIADYTQQIADKQAQIDVLETQINEKQAQVDANQAEIDAAEEKLKERMVEQQPTMRLNSTIDVLMGASSFDDLLRIANGLSAITEKDEDTMNGLADKIDQLKKDKAEIEQTQAQVEEEQAQIETLKAQVVDQQNQLLALEYQAQVIEEEYQKQSAELEAQGNRYAAQIDAIKKQMQEISEKLNEVAASPGWTYPVPGAHISAGTWSYNGGGVHLGMDFAAPVNTAIRAVGNGVVINYADGCGYGYLGNTCGYQYGGSTGGGNQVYLLTKINGNLYAVKYLHMNAGTPVHTGTIVNAGDTVGRVGSSGNSTGPHCHIEVFYLGSSSNFTKYSQNWDGDLAFGCGWGRAALNRLCENGTGAPCRVKPESVFGG